MMKTKEKYKVAHFTNEIGRYIVGGIATVMNELYQNRDEETCFLHIFDERFGDTISTEDYPGDEDIYVVSINKLEEIKRLNFDIAVLHYYGLADAVSEEIIGNKKLIYVIHSVTTPEPYETLNPFGIHKEVENIFRYLCHRADKLICVSEAEKLKLESILPETQGKVTVVYNGITFDDYIFKKKIHKKRTKFGYLGRMDYRKGILETLRTLKKYNEYQYYLASGKGDYNYLREIKIFIEAAEMEKRVHFLGYCNGKRRDCFLKEIDCLIISSLYEPFGMILLEALQNDVPVICSNNGGLAEIMGDYKYQYNPYEEDGLENILQQFVQDNVNDISMECTKLKDRLKLFTSERMAEQYQKVFYSVL